MAIPEYQKIYNKDTKPVTGAYRGAAVEALMSLGRPSTTKDILKEMANLGLTKNLKPYKNLPLLESLEETLKNGKHSPSGTPIVPIGGNLYALREWPKNILHLGQLGSLAKGSGLSAKKFHYAEKDLHPIVAYYFNNFLNVYLKTIDHNKSKGKGSLEKIHPDMAGAEFIVNSMHPTTKAFLKKSGNWYPIDTYSIEIKRELTKSDFRESYQQAVSNSSWANYGYLAVARITNDHNMLAEIKSLVNVHGIGLVKLDEDNPDRSEVVYEARRRPTLDNHRVDQLCRENTDFGDLLDSFIKYIGSEEIGSDKYDQVLELEEIQAMFASLKNNGVDKKKP